MIMIFLNCALTAPVRYNGWVSLTYSLLIEEAPMSVQPFDCSQPSPCSFHLVPQKTMDKPYILSTRVRLGQVRLSSNGTRNSENQRGKAKTRLGTTSASRKQESKLASINVPKVRSPRLCSHIRNSKSRSLVVIVHSLPREGISYGDMTLWQNRNCSNKHSRQ